MANLKIKISPTLLLALVPMGFYFYLLQKYAVNIPYYDDHALKAFILNFDKAPTFSEKIQVLFQQHNEHRIVFTRLITLITYWLKGSIDYTWLMWIGNATLLGIWYFLTKTTHLKTEDQSPKSETTLFLPLSLVLFTQMFWENTYWGMASVQNFGVLFFVIGLFYFLNQEGVKNFNRAVLFAVLATFTSGNGFLALPIAIFILLLQKQNRRAIIFTSISVALAAVYFYHYQAPTNPAYHGTLKEYTKAFLAFLGNLTDNPNADLPIRLKYLIPTGAILLVFSIFYGIKLVSQRVFFSEKNSQNSLFHVGCLLFLIGSALIVSVTRLGFGLPTMLTSRYKIYSILLAMIWLSVFLQWTSSKKWVYQIVLLGAVIFNIWMNYTYFQETVFQHRRMIAYDFNAGYVDFSGKKLSSPQIPYHAPKQFYDDNVSSILVQMKDTIDFSLKIKPEGQNLGIQSSQVVDAFFNEPVFVTLTSYQRTYLIPTRQNRNATQDFFLKNGIYFVPGFSANIDTNELPNGQYHVGILTTQGNQIIAKSMKNKVLIDSNKKIVKVNW